MTPEELEDEFLRLAAIGEMDKILRILASKFDSIPHEVVREVLQESCLEIVKRRQDGGDLTNVPGLLMTIGRRKLIQAHEDLMDGYSVEAVLRRRHEEGDWQHDEQRQASIERAVRFVTEKVSTWPDNNVRRTLLTIIDAAKEGLQLEPIELDRILGCARGTSRVWRERAYDRLRAQLQKEGLTWDLIVELLPTDDEPATNDHYVTDHDDHNDHNDED